MSEQTSPETPVVGWSVTGQTEDTNVTPDGRVEHGVKVLFRTSSGVDSSVFVPNASYNAVNVRAAITARAAVLESVAGLSSSPAQG